MIVTAVFIAVFLILGIVENRRHRKRLETIPIRILVNGTRGKTSVALTIARALNEGGIRTIARTTGSEALVSFPDGHTEPFRRRLPARITEMISFVKTAKENDVQCIVAECMALGWENQKTISRMLVRPTHLVITNSYVDHVSEIGSTEKQTVWTLANSMNPHCKVFSPDARYEEYCREKDCTFLRTEIRDFGLKSNGIPVHNDNVSIVCDLCADLGVGEETVLSVASDICGDIGLEKDITLPNGVVLVPSFSVNDIHCMAQTVREESQKRGRRVNVVFSNRSDREYRIELVARVIAKYKDSIEAVYCIGEYPRKVSSCIKRRTGFNAMVSEPDSLYGKMSEDSCGAVYVGLGNIKGSGELLVRLCKEGR